jgi:hypothetical protein
MPNLAKLLGVLVFCDNHRGISRQTNVRGVDGVNGKYNGFSERVNGNGVITGSTRTIMSMLMMRRCAMMSFVCVDSSPSVRCARLDVIQYWRMET